MSRFDRARPADQARKCRIDELTRELHALLAEDRAVIDRRSAENLTKMRGARWAVAAMTPQQREDYRTYAAAGFTADEAVAQVLGTDWQQRWAA